MKQGKYVWAEQAIMTVTTYGLMEGYDDGEFKPGEKVTKAQLLTVIARRFEVENETSGTNPFEIKSNPIIKKIMMGIPAASAMLSTGLSFTTVNAGDLRDPQIRAKTAETTMFLRCIREEDLYAGLEKIKKIGAKYGVTVEEMERDYCVPTDFEGEAYKTVEALLHENFPDVAVAPFLLLLLMKIIAPEYLIPLTETNTGRIVSTISLVLIIVAWLIIERGNEFEI